MDEAKKCECACCDHCHTDNVQTEEKLDMPELHHDELPVEETSSEVV